MVTLHAAHRTDYEFSVNTNIVNKAIHNNHSNIYRSNSGSIDELISHIGKGYSFCPAQFKKNERKLENVIQSGVLGFDIDNTGENKFTLDDWAANPWLVKHTFYYTTCSHTQEHHRFRIILPFRQGVTRDVYEASWESINRMTGGAGDRATRHPAVPFYGNTKAVFSDNIVEPLPWSFIVDMDKEAEKIEILRAERTAAQAQKALEFADTKPELEDIASALGYISSDCCYDDWFTVGCALVNATNAGDDGLAMFDNWSATSPKYKGTASVEQKWYSLRDNPPTIPVTVGSLFYMAKENGWVREAQVKKPEIVDQEKTVYTPTIQKEEDFVTDTLNEHYKEGERVVIGVRAPKNTGKSYWLKQIIANESKVILLGDRRILTKTYVLDNNLSYINQDADSEDAIAAYTEFGKIACVIDSAAKKLSGLYIDGGVLIIDEAEQLADSLLNGETEISKHRGATMNLFRAKLPYFEKIILCDADLTDRTVDFFCSIANMPAFKYENTFRENHRKCYLHTSESDLLSQMDTDIAKGKNVMYVSDSQIQCEALHKAYAKKGNVTVLLTRDSIDNNPELQHYLSNKGEKIQRDDIQVVFGSPVMQSGISIEIEHFHAVYGNFQGVIVPKTASQMLMRVRGHCPRHVFCVTHGIKVPQLFTAEDVLKNIRATEEIQREYITVEKYNDPTIEDIHDLPRINFETDRFFALIMKTKCEILAEKNVQRHWYRSSLIEQLERDGYELTIINSRKKSNIDMKEEVEVLRREEATRIVSAELVSETEKRRLENKDTLNTVEKAQLTKAVLHSTLPHFPIALDEEFVYTYVIKDRYKTIKSIENNFLVMNKEIALQRDVRAIKAAVKLCPTMPLLFDVKTKTPLLALWDKLQLASFLDKEITANSTARFKELCVKHPKVLRIFNIVPTEKGYGIALMKKVFAIFGYEVNKLKSGTSGRVYVVEKIALFHVFYDSIQTRYTENEEKRIQKEKEAAEAEMKKLSNWYGGGLKRKPPTTAADFVFNDHFS